MYNLNTTYNSQQRHRLQTCAGGVIDNNLNDKSMDLDKEAFGIIKLTVGVKRGTKEKIQYCLTAIENDQ